MFKNFKVVISLVFLGVVLILSQSSQVAAISVKELLGLEKSQKDVVENKEQKDAKKDAGDWAKTAGQDSLSTRQIDLEYVSLLINNMNEQERTKVLQDPEVFRQVIENEANNRSVVSAAIANKLSQDRNVDFLMRRGVENILRESYLNRLIATKLPKDFPNEEQISEYFETNKDQFVVPERIHVWQIFFKKSEKADSKEIAEIKKKANKLISDIKKGKKEFSSVAIDQSEHEQSKALGGYMGLLNTNDLLPEMKDSILKLKEEELSKAVESESGIHILKRGKILKSEMLELSQIKPQIRQLLLKQANLQLRQAIYTQARKEYPQNIPDKKLEEWLLRLKTNTN
jgi:parvulin-like peptidyl-prolyl isomerase